jgi:hypothetical protein
MSKDFRVVVRLVDGLSLPSVPEQLRCGEQALLAV